VPLWAVPVLSWYGEVFIGGKHQHHHHSWRAVKLCSPFLRWGGRLCPRCAAGGCARAVLVWGGVSRG